MSKFRSILFGLVLIFVPIVPAYAQSTDAPIPEKNGDYKDPEHKDIRVRVFVHEPREKKGLTQSANAVCDDPDSTTVVGSTGWKLPTKVSYRLNTMSVPFSVGGANLQSIVSLGFGAWTSSIASGAPTLTYAGTTTKNKSGYDGQNVIAWGRASSSALAVTYTWYYPATGLVAETDTIMNTKYLWTYNACSPTAYDAGNILTHEQGHWFGLDDFYDATYTNNTMFGYGSKGETKKKTPTIGDKNGINLIYH